MPSTSEEGLWKRSCCYVHLMDVSELQKAQKDGKVNSFLAIVTLKRSTRGVVVGIIAGVVISAVAVYTPPECTVP